MSTWGRRAVFRHERRHYGETEIAGSVCRRGETWGSGIEKDAIQQFLTKYGLRMQDHMNARDIERHYFKDERGNATGRVNDTHCIVTAGKV
jgi:hypothetical protein